MNSTGQRIRSGPAPRATGVRAVAALAAKHRAAIIVAAVVAIRPLMVFLALADCPPLWKHDGWSFYTGGDELEYFALARSLADLEPVASNRSLGYPLLLAPVVAITHADDVDDIQPWIVLLQAALGGAAATWVLYRLARAVGAPFGLSALGAAAFALFPYWLLLPSLWPPRYRVELSGWNISYQLGLAPYADVPAQIAQLAVALLLLQSVETGSAARAAAAGACGGVAALIRITNIPYIAGIAVYPLVLALSRAIPRDRRRALFRTSLVYGATALAVFAPQLVYNAVFFGSPFHWGYHALGGQAAADHRLDLGLGMARVALLFAHPAGMIWKSLLLMALTRFFWRCREPGTLLISWGLVSYTLLLFAYPLFRQDPFRLGMPLVPYAALGLGALAYWPLERFRAAAVAAAKERSA